MIPKFLADYHKKAKQPLHNLDPPASLQNQELAAAKTTRAAGICQIGRLSTSGVTYQNKPPAIWLKHTLTGGKRIRSAVSLVIQGRA